MNGKYHSPTLKYISLYSLKCIFIYLLVFDCVIYTQIYSFQQVGDMLWWIIFAIAAASVAQGMKNILCLKLYSSDLLLF